MIYNIYNIICCTFPFFHVAYAFWVMSISHSSPQWLEWEDPGLEKYFYRWSLVRGVCAQKVSCYGTKWVGICLISTHLFFPSSIWISFLLQFQTVSHGLQWLGFLKEIFVTFICGTDSPVNMASSTMQEPRSNTISHGISTSEVLDLPGSKQRKRKMISLIIALPRHITIKVEMPYFSVPLYLY